MFKRALVAASVFAAFTAPAAMADVTVYGSVRASVETSNADGLSQTRLVDEKSRVGFKGTDKLDSGLDLFFKLESRVKLNGKDSTFGGRDQVIGLKGKDLGTFTFGKSTNAYADATYINPVLDNVWGISDDSDLYQQGTTDRVATIKYESPAYAGFAYALSYGDFNDKDKSTSKAAYAAAANYTTSLFNVGAAYQHYKDATVTGYTATTTAGDKADSFLVGFGVTPGSGLTFGAHYERQQNTFSGVKQYQDDIGIGAQYEAGKFAYRAQYIVQGDFKGDSAQADTGAQHLVLSAKYSLSKQSSLLVAANYLKADSKATGETLGLANGIYAKAGESAKALSVGLKTDF